MELLYNKLVFGYNFTNNIPKEMLFVTLDPDISDDRRNFIANGIRSYFRDDLTVLIDKKSFLEYIMNILMMLELFVIIVGLIALILTFFLLLISTSSNVKENVWELGVLRAIGLEQKQIQRVFMFEAFTVVLSALMLGIIVGLVVAISLTA
jgi:ABC-type antimicrobial peptide transport system permease subunit